MSVTNLSSLSCKLEWDGDEYGKSTIICDTPLINGSFLVHCFISTQLNHSRPICLISFDHNLNHYINIAKKLGTNLKQNMERNQFIYIDGATELLNRYDLASDHEIGLRDLYQRIQQLSRDHQNLCLIIDPISALVEVSKVPGDVVDFVKQLQGFFKSIKKGSFIAMLHGYHGEKNEMLDTDTADLELNERDCCNMELLYSFDKRIFVESLSSGLSREVDGQMRVHTQKESDQALFFPQTIDQKYYFRVKENGVKLIQSL